MILAQYPDHNFVFSLSSVIAYSLGVIFVCSMIYGMLNKNVEPLKFNDNFDLGYVRDNVPTAMVIEEQYDELKELKRKLEIAKLKKQLAELEKPTYNNELFNDCVDSLIGLGTPSRKAKAEAQNIFNKNPNIKTVQEFITEYGKR
jgi:hypothetical protein